MGIEGGKPPGSSRTLLHKYRLPPGLPFAIEEVAESLSIQGGRGDDDS